MNRPIIVLAVGLLLSACGGGANGAGTTTIEPAAADADSSTAAGATQSTPAGSDPPGTTAPASADSSSASTTNSAAVRTDAASTTSDDQTSTDAGLPVTVIDDRGRSVTVESIDRIIPLDGEVAEIVFALGLGDRVVATDLSATYPPEADALPQIGFQRALDTEPILEFEPTVTLGTELVGPESTLDDLERVGVPVVIVPRRSDPTAPADKIRAVADALGISDAGAALAAKVQSEIETATEDGSSYNRRPRVLALYLRGEDIQLVMGDGTGIDWLIDAAGAIDLADELGVVDTAPITAEAILAADPDVLLVPEGGLASAGGLDGLLAIPGIAETPAGRAGAVLAYDDQLMLGNGPRTGQFLTQLVSDLHELDQNEQPA